MIMKKLLLFSAVALILSSCGIASNTRSAEDALTAQKVKNAVNSSVIQIDILQTRSQSGFNTNPNRGEYFIEIADGKLTSYLPFFGTSNMGGVFNGDNLALNVQDEPINLITDRTSAMKGKYTLSFKVKDRGNTWNISITLWDNGRASITANITGRSIMNYEGEMR